MLEVHEWDENFFTEFVGFKNLIHRDISTSLPEELSDYSKYFAQDSVFSADFSWKGFILKENGRTVAQAILTWKKLGTVANLGFLDWVDDLEHAQKLVTRVTEVARSEGIKSLKTPVDLNFFVKYRIRVPGGAEPLFGEPVYPDYYHRLFKGTGFKTIGEWDTYLVDRFKGIRDFFRKRKLLSERKDVSHSMTKKSELKTTIRCLRTDDWDREMRIIYELFSEAYQKMPEYEAISFEQFQVMYQDFKYIVQPWLSYIIELKGKPVGFSINYMDPLPVLNSVRGKKLGPIQKALLFLRLRSNTGTFMISHVGKIPGPNGEDIKGVQIQVSKRIALHILYVRRVVVCFQNADSPSRRTWNPETRSPYASYLLYGMDL
ncbi:MAG TPA: hypothetical protein VNJ01_10140 [Bacteriovoracaceae bacterium]|nr:hypothetical protein [Bacteriovoracaceae bacterium]